MMIDVIAGEIVDKIIEELDDRSLFNGVDNDTQEEIREALYDIVTKEML
jgi:hypothetical protein